MTSSLYLAEIFISRLCHDLIAPIGAINTGFELLPDPLPPHLTDSEEILNLIFQSAHIAAARLSFFRIAFGRQNNSLKGEELKILLENYLKYTKLILQWEMLDKDALPPQGVGNLVLNAALWMSECAPRGGELRIALRPGEKTFLSLFLTAECLSINPASLTSLQQDTSLQDLTARTLPAYLIRHFLKERKIDLIYFHPSSKELHIEFSDLAVT